MSSVPTDSVLRRHHEQMRQAVRSAPTDSVLRRHHDQMQQAARSEAESIRAPEPMEQTPAPEPATPTSPVHETAEPASPPPAAARPADTPAPAVSSQGGGGFFGWLKRLFGG